MNEKLSIASVKYIFFSALNNLNEFKKFAEKNKLISSMCDLAIALMKNDNVYLMGAGVSMATAKYLKNMAATAQISLTIEDINSLLHGSMPITSNNNSLGIMITKSGETPINKKVINFFEQQQNSFFIITENKKIKKSDNIFLLPQTKEAIPFIPSHSVANTVHFFNSTLKGVLEYLGIKDKERLDGHPEGLIGEKNKKIDNTTNNAIKEKRKKAVQNIDYNKLYNIMKETLNSDNSCYKKAIQKNIDYLDTNNSILQISDIIQNSLPDFYGNKLISSENKINFFGVGKSKDLLEIINANLKKLNINTSSNGPAILHDGVSISQFTNSDIITLSNSGKTNELHCVLKYLKNFDQIKPPVLISQPTEISNYFGERTTYPFIEETLKDWPSSSFMTQLYYLIGATQAGLYQRYGNNMMKSIAINIFISHPYGATEKEVKKLLENPKQIKEMQQIFEKEIKNISSKSK